MAFPSHLPALDPGSDCVPITPSDSATFAPCRAFWIGTAGNLRLRTHGSIGTTRTVPVVAGLFPVGGDMVYSTNTTASSIFAIY